MNFLEQRWNTLWPKLGPSYPRDNVMEQLRLLYEEQKRTYHNWTHIRECFDYLDETVEDGVQFIYRPEECELAIWFHDAISNTQVTDNEVSKCSLGAKYHRTTGRITCIK